MLFDQITIVGVGLIGGSVGLAAKARGVAKRVVGVDRRPEVLARALDLGAIDAAAFEAAQAVDGSALVVVATPVDRIAEAVVEAAASCTPRLFTDTGSVKGGLFQAVRQRLSAAPSFVPAHPLAGAEKNGVEHARADLFENRVTIITPDLSATRPADIDRVADFWSALGARIVNMDADEHDRVLARTSHLPHAVASAVAGATPPHLLGLTAGGFRDVTRIAAGDPGLWAAIFEANREGTLAALSGFTDRLSEFRTLLEAGDHAGLVRWLAQGKQVRDALGT
jgi:prephenate dehydrogenase